jgi:hypothetical protein
VVRPEERKRERKVLCTKKQVVVVYLEEGETKGLGRDGAGWMVWCGEEE